MPFLTLAVCHFCNNFGWFVRFSLINNIKQLWPVCKVPMHQSQCKNRGFAIKRYMLLVELPLFARSGLGVGIAINTIMSSGRIFLTSSYCFFFGKNSRDKNCFQLIPLKILHSVPFFANWVWSIAYSKTLDTLVSQVVNLSPCHILGINPTLLRSIQQIELRLNPRASWTPSQGGRSLLEWRASLLPLHWFWFATLAIFILLSC